ncbi:hypothetical protein [Streptomyces aureus]|uniref:hypothetical protein n=1 Tax=Streptomyces aureus TaxID=193461 RepID=UPI001AE065CE|nr:hypothetical protein [Streptomyces aureus]
MGRRIRGRRAGDRYARRPWHGRTLAAAAAVAALCAALAPGGRADAASGTADSGAPAQGVRTAADDAPGPYAFGEDDATVKGTADSTDAALLRSGRTYRSSVGVAGKDGRLYYRVELDDTSDAYVSATAVPRPGTTVTYSDGLKVSLQDANGRNCSFTGTVHFGATQSPHPIAAWASRESSGDPYACRAAGTYYMVVERVGAAGTSSGTSSLSGTEPSASRPWDLELGFVTEPALKTTSGPTRAPDAWNSASPEALVGEPRKRGGGAGFGEATRLEQGAWKDGISPGQTLFYKVPVDWGQQVYATADLGSASGGEGSIGTALVLSLYNPVRGLVDGVGAGYDGSQRSAGLDPLPPVAYENRFALNDRVSGMRFAGSYYLVVHLAAQVADRFGDGPFGLTLRVRVSGAAGTGPAYAGAPSPQDVFAVPAGGSDSAQGDGPADSTPATGKGGAGAGHSTSMKLLAAGGIGTGTLLMLTLGLWTAIARRRAVRTARPAPQDADTASATLPLPAPWEHGATRGR